jgi:hypothetical protein
MAPISTHDRPAFLPSRSGGQDLFAARSTDS